MWPTLLVAVLTMALLWLWLWCRSTFSYWHRRGIPTLQPCRPPFGHLGDALLLTPLVDIIQRLYRATDEPYVGVYMLGSPLLLVNSPELIQRVLVTDFGHFTARGFSAHRDYDPLAENIIHIDDRQFWKRIRSKLTSPFSLNKVKTMVTKIDESAKDVVQVFSRSCQAGESVHATQLANRYMIDTILSCAFGIKGNAVLDPNSEFRVIGTITFGLRFVMHVFIGIFFPRLHKLLGLTVASKKVTKFFLRLAKEAQQARQTDTNAKDFLHALLQLKEQDEKDRREGLNADQAVIDDEFVAAQMFMFFGAGFESPGNTVAFCLHELSLHPGLQEKVRQEVTDILSRHGGQLTYEALQDMTFLDKFLQEAMRKYPVLTLVFRRCTKEYQLPGSKASIEAGTTVLIPTAAIHHDPNYYPSPEHFDPERFSEASIAARHPATFIPFGAGPRNCPAVVFSMVQMKVVLVRILQHFEFSLEASVPDPLPLAPFNFLLSPREEVKLRATLRTA